MTFEEWWEQTASKLAFKALELDAARMAWNAALAEKEERIRVLEAQVADVHQSYQSGKAWQEQEARLTEQFLNKEELAVIYLQLPATVADGLIKHLRTQQARIDVLEANIKLGVEGERRDCEKALLALAGKYPTPVEGYGINTSWAISELCRAFTNAQARIDVLEAQRRTELDRQTEHWAEIVKGLAARIDRAKGLAHGVRAAFSDLAVEMEKHSNDHIASMDSDKRLAASIEGVCADRIYALLPRADELLAALGDGK
jgi:hypothetical protein